MEKHGVMLAAVLLLCATNGLSAPSEVFRCTARDRAVTYQQIPCTAGSDSRVVDLPSAYPEYDRAERERLLQREAALDARMLKRAELETAERIAREERLAREREAEAQRERLIAAPIYIVARPFGITRPLPRHPLRFHRDFGSR